MLKEICYRELAKEAKSRGDMKGVWRAFKQHARVMKKKRALQLLEQLEGGIDNNFTTIITRNGAVV